MRRSQFTGSNSSGQTNENLTRRRARLARAVAKARPKTAWIEAFEPRILLSASLTYRPQKADGSLDTPVTFQTQGGIQDFTPSQISLLQNGFAAPTYDLFLKATGITGDSTDDQHPDEINVLSFNWGADATPGTLGGGGAGVGKTQLQEIHLTSHVSKATPLLLDRLTDGTHIQNADLTVRKRSGDQPEFLTINLADVTIGSYQVTTALDGTFVEEFTLNFQHAQMAYRPQKPDGSLDAPIVVQENLSSVIPFVPQERSILQDGFHSLVNQSLFLSLDTIPGESTSADHQNAIDIKSFSWGGDALGGGLIGGGGGAGKTVLEEVHFVAQVSKASPKLLSALASGVHIPNAHFAAVKNGVSPFTFLNLDLQDVQISSYQLSTGANGKILEEFTLNFGKASLDYTPQKSDGSADTPINYTEQNGEVSDFAPTQVSLLDTGNTNTAANAFLHIDGVPGESTGEQNQNDIDVLSFSWGGDATATQFGGGAGAGKSTLQDLHVVSRFSKASPLLLARLNSGQHIPAADLVVRSAADNHPEFFRIDLTNAIVSSYRVTTAQDGTLLEEYTLSFAQSGLTYTTLNNDGSVGSATSFTENQLEVQNFTPPQPSLLDGPITNHSNNLGLFLTVDGIPGESTAKGHENQIDILSFGWGGHGTQTISGGGGGVGKTFLHELHFIAPVSQASPKVFGALASGKHIATAHFGAVHLPGGSGAEFLTAELQNVIVSSDQIIVGKDGKLVEEFTLTFQTISLDYKPQNDNGSLGMAVHFGVSQPSFESYAPTQRALLDTGFTGPGAANAFLKIANLPGESTSSAHPNEIEVLSFSWGGDATAAVSGGGGSGAGKTTLQQLHIVSRFSKASPLLLARMNSGQHIQTADLALSRPGKNQGDFFTINLKDVIVTSYKVTTARDGTLLEEFTLAFAQSSETYKPQQLDGSLGAPITFNETGLGFEAFAPHQDMILQTGLVKPTSTDLFLNINGIDGESTSDAHPDEIDLLAFSWGGQSSVTSTSSGGGAGAGKTTFQELHFVSRISKASPTLLSRVLSGQHIPDATFTVERKSNGQDFLKIRLQDVTITSYQITTALDGTAIEEFTLSFAPTPSPTGPNADAGGPYNVNDNGSVTLDASASTDPDPASLTYAWDLDGDGIFGETGAAAARGDEVGINPVFNAAGLFGPNVFQVTVRITDGAGLSDTASSSVRIVDVTPPDTIILTGPPALTNQTTATFTFTGTDQGTPSDQLTFTAKLDGGSPFDVTSPLTFSNLTDGVHTLQIFATDQAGNTDPTPATYTWKVDTVGPNVVTPLASPSPVSVGVPITLTATISDILTGASNIAGAQYSLDGMTWFNMTSADGSFNSPTEAVKANLAPLPAGIYTIFFRGSDAAGNTGPISSITLPVFDRDAGFVTGGGNFDSPAGADVLHPTHTGKAEIQIEAQYKKDANVPTGTVKFKVDGINFQSTSIDYLIITGGNAARLAGSGQINGQGDYSFEISLIDGNPGKGSGGDLFRIRIVNKATGQVIYDNGLGSPISAPPLTFLNGGNIKVHD